MMTAAGEKPEVKKEGKLCSACFAWLCAADDAYCGGCGHLCAQLVIEVLPPVLPFGRPLLPKVAIRLTNPACVSLRLKRISTPEWLDLEVLEEIEIGPGSSRVFLAKACTAGMREAQSSEVSAQTTLGDASVLVMAIPEPPVLFTSPAQIEYWPDEELSVRHYEIDLYPPVGHLRILQLREPGAAWLTLSPELASPVLVSKNAPLRSRVQFDPRRLAGGKPGKAGSKLTAQVGVSFEGAHGEEQMQVTMLFEIRRPPELIWTGEHAPPRILSQTAGQVLTFTFVNSTDADPFAGRQNATIELKSATLGLPAGREPVCAQWRPLLPRELAGGQSRDIEFHVNLQSLEPGIHYFELKVETTTFDRTFRVPVEIRALERFGGAVAIDFGTSNTCCALLADGGDFENVPLDEQRTTAPTLVRYLDLSGPEPLTETGSDVKHRAAVEEKVASSTLTRLKQCLGESTYPLKVRPANSPDWTMREARDAAADYLRHIRTVAEKRKAALFSDFILTHPAVCSLRQYRNLRWALENAFGRNARIHFLQEPIAALVPFFKEIGQNGVRPSYTVAAFDLGGGTTDITVVRVVQSAKSSGARVIRPEILASWGERFGGEDLTDFLVKEVEARCGDMLAVQRAGYRLADEGVSGASTSSIRRNEAAFREWAEEFKSGISEERNAHKLPRNMLLGIVPESRELMPEDKEFVSGDICSRGENLQQVFVRHLAEKIGKLAERLQDSVRNIGTLDFIHLSGKTALLKEVRGVLAERFPGAEIQRAADPKECVVLGACLWRSLARGKNLRLVLPSGASRTTSQIGLLDEDGTFLPVIPHDRPIPDGGLQVEIPDAWEGQDRIVLWENLGIENCRIRPDKSLNPLISRLGAWEPANPLSPEHSWNLRLCLYPDFSFKVAAFSGNRLVELRPVQGQR